MNSQIVYAVKGATKNGSAKFAYLKALTPVKKGNTVRFVAETTENLLDALVVPAHRLIDAIQAMERKFTKPVKRPIVNENVDELLEEFERSGKNQTI